MGHDWKGEWEKEERVEEGRERKEKKKGSQLLGEFFLRIGPDKL